MMNGNEETEEDVSRVGSLELLYSKVPSRTVSRRNRRKEPN
jgi:hypothetical protein